MKSPLKKVNAKRGNGGEGLEKLSANESSTFPPPSTIMSLFPPSEPDLEIVP
jgi:hypothetical protein